MSDPPMYWSGHQRPAWHQQPSSGQQVNSMSHYTTHPGSMLANPMAPGLPNDPALQMQSSIPGRHQPHQSISQHQSTLAPLGAQSSLYPSMMPTPGGPSSSARPTTQLTSNSHLTASTQGIPPPHPGLQQPPHPQSHYPHQYSSLASSYWNPPQMGGQSSLGPSSASSSSAATQGAGPPPPPTQQQQQQPDGSSYHSSSASPLAMPNESRSSISTNPSAPMQPTGQSFHSPKDIQSSAPDHMMSYDRQRATMPQQQQQQHQSAMMSQNVPSSTASNLSPTQSQLSMQGRLQSQSQIDSMRSMSQQSSAASNAWTGSYYGQPSQLPYSSVMNPYLPYSGAGSVPNHAPSVGQPPARPTMSQKPSTNGSERARATYPPHASSIYGQPPPPTGSTNGSYYGYDSYYNQTASTDPYLPHPNQANASQHWPSTATSNQLMSNSSTAPVPIQPPLRPQTGSTGSSIHPQSPSASSTLPTLSSRPPPPSQTPERSPATQHPTSYPSPNQQGSSSKPASNSLAQLEQMVMPGSNQNATSTIKSPTQRSSTSSPNANTQQQLQYSYNSSGQGSYFSTGAGSVANQSQSNYYPQYDPSGGVDIQKPGWSEQGPVMNSGPMMMDGGQSSYGPSSYDGAGTYGEYTSLSTPANSCTQPRFSTPGDNTDSHTADKGDPYAIDSQTFDDYDDQSASSKTKKGRAKKGEEKVKKERKPRAPRAPKAGSTPVQPQSPSPAATSLQPLQAKSSQPPQQITPIVPQASDISPATQIPGGSSYPSPGQQPSTLKPPATEAQPQMGEPMVLPSSVPQIHSSVPKSPTHRLSTESPTGGPQQQQQMQYSYNSGSQSGYYTSSPSVPANQSSYYPPYESGHDAQKSWQEPGQSSLMTSSIPPSGTSLIESGQSNYNQPTYESSSAYGGEFTPLSAPTNSTVGQARYPPIDDTLEVPPPESIDAQTTDSQTLDDSTEQVAATKGKKTRAKKGDDKVKKERKPRASRAAKSSSSAQSSSPISTTPIQGLSANESISTPPQSYPSANYSTCLQPSDEASQNDPATNPKSVASSTPPSKSPSHRLSTESPNLHAPAQPQYTYSGQSSYLSSGSTGSTGQTSGQYYSGYDNADDQKSCWSDQAPPVAARLSPSGTTTAADNSTFTPATNFDASSSNYADYTSFPPSGSSPLKTTVPVDGAETALTESAGEATVTDPAAETTTEKPVSSKSKKSRAKRSEERTKKERKPRAAKSAAQQPTVDEQQTSLSTSTPPPAPESTDDATETQTVQTESTPAEPKPKRIRIRDSSSKGKKKLPKFALKFAKTKKRKRLGSSDNDQSDLDKTPPPSPDEVESGVLKRRSARNTKKLKYNDDIALGFSDSDDDSQILPRSKKSTPSANITNDGDSTAVDEFVAADEPTVFAAPVEDTMVVEKIMASRTGKRELEPEPGEVLPPDGTHIEVEEFYVKYKNLSYLHCDWRTLEELEKGDRRVAQKLKRYKQKKDSSNLFSFMDEDLFDAQYCEVDRILAVNEVEEMVPESDDEEKPAKKEDEVDTLSDSRTVENTVLKEEPNEDVIETEASKTENESQDKSVTGADDTTKMDITSATEVEEKPVEDKPAEEKPVVDESAEVQPVVETKPEDDDKKVEEPKVSETDGQDVKDESTDSRPKSESALAENNAVAVANEPDLKETLEKPKKMKKKISRHYLVKWRGLSYEDSTWELEDDLDVDKIKHFQRFKDPPPKSKWKSVKRPKPEEWVRKETSPVYKNNNTLREYQLEGINWLSFCWHQGRNCILADEMGLGKTIQSIAFINEIYQKGIYGPFLIIVPLSTVGNWAREFETWTDLNVITYHGSSTSREMLKEYEMFYRNEQGNRITSYYKFQVMITTFEIILSDCLDLREIPWRCCIIDEAHRLKNRNCKLLEGLRLLNMEHRVLLTGTPLQNNVEELFSLLNFLEPTQFSSTEQFLQEFGDLKTEAQVDKLKVILKPMMLRRLKEDVEKSLAPKEETIVEVELTNIQKKYYRAILEKNFSFLTKGSSSNNMPNLMNTMMELRKCCIHPYLINGAEEQILYEAREAKLAGGEPMSSFQAMVNSSGKLVLIDKLLPRLRADGHRVLIFSQMVRCLDILEDYVTHKHYPFERIDGRVRGGDRQQAIDRFSKPGSDRFVFLLCTRAGGLGINLTAADTVIIFDSDWNPQNDLQAQARCHRIGQSKAVKIYRLICRNTYEREMFDKASLKLGLDKAVLQSMNTQKGGAGGHDGQLTKKEIEELLRKGAYGALMDDDNAGDKFCEEDIDQILQRRTQVITIDNSEAKGSTFSRATFSSSNNRDEIELDDPNFWEKWAKKANIDSDDLLTKDELIQLEPRRRTQTKRYGADGNLIDISDLDSSEEDEETISMRTRGSRGRQPKLTPSSVSKRSKRNRMFEHDDDEFMSELDGGYWSKYDCLKVEKGLLTFGWGRWEEIIASNHYKRKLTPEDCESICRVILLYCLNNYKGDEKIKSFAWELIAPLEDSNKSSSDLENSLTTRGRKPKSVPILSKKTTAEEIADAKWPKEAKNDPLIALPDDQYRRHLQRNSNRLLIRVRFLYYLKNDILGPYNEKILANCNINEIDIPAVPVDGELPAPWWDDDADKSLLVGIFKYGHDKFNSMRQDANLCFLHKCGPPNKEDLMAEMNFVNRSVDDLDDENRDASAQVNGSNGTFSNLEGLNKDSECPEVADAGVFLVDLVDNVVKGLSNDQNLDKNSNDIVDENKNNILKNSSSQDSLGESFENGVAETSRTTKMDITDDDSVTNETTNDAVARTDNGSVMTMEIDELLPFPTANDLNQRFRRLITAYQRNSKKLEIKMAQKARDELKRERTSKFEAAKHEREERKKSQAQKWSKGHEADFLRAISSFGVEYDPVQKKHDWNRFRSVGKLDKKLDETLEEYYRAFIAMCKKVTSRPLSAEEKDCSVSVEPLSEERAARCLSRIELLNKIREQIATHSDLDEILKQCQSQSDLPDWWENGTHDKDLLIAAAKHGLTRLDHNLAHDPTLSFSFLIRQKMEHMIGQPPATKISIPLEQLQELLQQNGIEYLDIQEDTEDVSAVLNSILDQIDADDVPTESSYRSFAELVDGPHSQNVEDSTDKASSPSPKTTRSTAASSGSNLRQTPNILSKRGSSTVVKLAETSGSNPDGVKLTAFNQSSRFDNIRLVEVTPIPPNELPDELTKNLEAGDLTVTLQSDTALLELYDKPPIKLSRAINPIIFKIRWLRDKAIQTRLENLVYLIENNQWPSPPRPANALPNQTIPTITLPNPISSSIPTAPLSVTTTSPSKNDKFDMSMGSPKSDISNISSRTSRQDSKEQSNDLTTSRGRRGRTRRPRQSDVDTSVLEADALRDEGQATAKLRNLLSQGPSSSKNVSPADKLSTKFGSNKQGAGLSSLLATFKQKRSDGSGSARGRDDNNMLDLNAPGSANLLPQILANMKPEFRDLLANQDAATMLINSLTSMGGANNIGSNLRSSSSQLSLDNILNAARSSSKGPPPAHQRSDNPPSAHGNTSARELRRNSQNTRDGSPPSINLRSTRGKGSSANLDNISHSKSSDTSHAKQPASKRRGRPSSSASDSPPGVPGADILDLSSLPSGGKSTSRLDSRSRRHRDTSDETSPGTNSRSGVPTKANLKAGSKQSSSSQESEMPEKGGRTTRASKRIGSRIDALALNLQAKRLNRGDSPSSEVSPSLPKEKSQDNLMAAHGTSKSSGEKSHSSKGPPAAHSGSHKSSSSSTNMDQAREKVNQTPSTANLLNQSTAPANRQDPLAQLMSNPASLLAGLNPSSLGGAGDIMNQLLRKAGSNDFVKNLLNEFMKNPSLALDPNVLATLTASLPALNTTNLSGFSLPTQQPPTTLPSTSTKNTASSLLNDFKSPSGNSLMKRSRQESSSSASRHSNNQSTSLSTDQGRRSSSSTPDRHERRSSSSNDKRSSYQERPDKHAKHDRRSGASGVPLDSTGDSSSSRRSSSSLLAQQAPTSQQSSQAQTSTSSTPMQTSLPNASTLNLASQFGGLNSLGGLLGFPGMNELMKQMSSFPGLAGSLPRVSAAPVMTNSTPTTNANIPSSTDKGSRRSRQSSSGTSSTTQTSTVSNHQQQQAANAALANSIMNLASQPNAANNPYGNYANPLANPFLPFGLANLGMNNPLGMGLFPNLYMPPGFPTPEQQQPQSSNQNSGSSSDVSSKDKKMRYPRK